MPTKKANKKPAKPAAPKKAKKAVKAKAKETPKESFASRANLAWR